MRIVNTSDDFGNVCPTSYRHDVCAFLAHVEGRYDVNALKFGGLHVWPIIRCMLASAAENQVLGYRYFPVIANVHSELVDDLEGIFGNVLQRPVRTGVKEASLHVGSLEDLATEPFKDAVIFYSRVSRIMKNRSTQNYENIDLDDFNKK